MMRLLACVVVVSAAAAQAQQASPFPTPTPPPSVAAGEDRTVRYTEEGEIYYGTPKRRLTPVQLFEAVGRQDLVSQSKVNIERRKVLFITAGVVAAVALGVGIALLATSPVMTGAVRCNSGDLEYYNSYCQPQWVLHQVSGTVTLGVGLAAASVLATLGLWARPDVLTPYELRKFIKEHNASLGPVSRLRVAPWLSTQGAGLSASAQF